MNKPRRTLVSIAAVVLAVACLCFSVACKKKPSAGNGGQVEVPAKVITPIATVDLDPSGFDSRRTQAFGFLSRLPATTEGAFGLTNFSELTGGMLKSQAFRQVIGFVKQMGGDYDVQMGEMVQTVIDQYFGKEMFLILSQGSSEQLAQLQMFSALTSQLSARDVGKGLRLDGLGGNDAIIAGLRSSLKDPDSELSVALEQLHFPPVIFGSKVADGSAEVIDALNQFEEQMPPIFTISKFMVGGVEFVSWRLNLQDVVTAGIEEQLDKILQDQATSKRVADVLRSKTVELTFGVMDEYLLFSLGADHQHLNFVESPEESILAAREFGFFDDSLDEKLLGYRFVSKPLLEVSATGGQFSKTAQSFAEGLAEGSEAMRGLARVIGRIAEQTEKLGKGKAETYVGIAYLDQGIRGESVGGVAPVLTDARAETKLAKLVADDAMMVFSAVGDPERRGDWLGVVEAVFEGVEAGMQAFAEVSGDDGGLKSFQQMNGLLGGHLQRIWGIMKGKLMAGLGAQSGVVMDLNGGVPKGIPGFPIVLQKEGKIPRMALVSDVVDRQKLSEAWDELLPQVNEALLKIPGQEVGREFQVPDVMSDDSDDLVTHYFSLPFLTKDFMPSLSLNEDWMFLSSSKQFSQLLLQRAKAESAAVRGTYLQVNFSQLQSFVDEWMVLVSANAEGVFPDEIGASRFKQSAVQVRRVLEFTQSLRQFEFNRYRADDGRMRGSWHLEVRDIESTAE